MPRYLHDHTKIYYRKTADLAETGYEVRMRAGDELVGRVRPSKSQSESWAYQLDNGEPGWVTLYGTRKDAADHLLSAYSPSAAWLV